MINSTSADEIESIIQTSKNAFDQRTAFLEDLTSEATTLPEGAESTSAFVENKLVLGIPRGAVGADGEDGLTPEFEFVQDGTSLVINLVGYVENSTLAAKEW